MDIESIKHECQPPESLDAARAMWWKCPDCGQDWRVSSYSHTDYDELLSVEWAKSGPPLRTSRERILWLLSVLFAALDEDQAEMLDESVVPVQDVVAAACLLTMAAANKAAQVRGESPEEVLREIAREVASWSDDEAVEGD